MATITTTHPNGGSGGRSGASLPVGVTLKYELTGHQDVISRIAWSPDGRYLASASRDKTVRIWDIATGTLVHTLTGHAGWVIDVTWSPDGKRLASSADDRTVRLWDVTAGQALRVLGGHEGTVKAVAWSPDGALLASGSEDKTIRLWNPETGACEKVLQGHTGGVYCLAWSPDAKRLASGSEDNNVRLWTANGWSCLKILQGHTRTVYSVQWSPDGQTLATSSNDKTTRLWDAKTRKEVRVLEGHTSGVNFNSFSFNGLLLATKSDSVRIWRTDSFDVLATIRETDSNQWPPGLAFHPTGPVLASLGAEDSDRIRVWDLDIAALLGNARKARSVQYANAKVVLLGDTGVGKSGLGLVLTNHPFQATISTHGRHVWTFDITVEEGKRGRRQTRETLLWDMAGQPGYRLVHQMHLNEVALALVLFDSKSETDPFAGVRHWVRALDQARRVQGEGAPPLRKVLVAARVDRGGASVSRATINRVMADLGFDDYIETSALEGWGIEELRRLIRASIPWDDLPVVNSPRLFQSIKDFLLDEKDCGRIIDSVDNLYRAFQQSVYMPDKPPADLRSQFETCLARVESRGLIRALDFGDMVLLQPEQLDFYASALVNAARDEPTGFGSIRLEDARQGEFRMPSEGRIPKRKQEQLLLHAVIEDMLGYEIALRVDSAAQQFLVFPSQFTREHPELPEPKGKALRFDFKGSVVNVYSTLAVRLAHSGVFRLDEMWRNAVTYTTDFNGTYGLMLSEAEEGTGTLTLFFSQNAGAETRHQFAQFVLTHLERRAIPGSVSQHHLYSCSGCGESLRETTIAKRRERGFNFIVCPVCDTHIKLERAVPALSSAVERSVVRMDRKADAEIEAQQAAEKVAAKRKAGAYDVFLCHNDRDKPKVIAIANELLRHGLLPWLDEWDLRPGQAWIRELERQIENLRSAAVFIGAHGLGPWQDAEIQGLLQEMARRGMDVIPVILDGGAKPEHVPLFLRNRTWVNFNKREPDPIRNLIWGITGEKDKDSTGPVK